jgi:hypothetical protein
MIDPRFPEPVTELLSPSSSSWSVTAPAIRCTLAADKYPARSGSRAVEYDVGVPDARIIAKGGLELRAASTIRLSATRVASDCSPDSSGGGSSPRTITTT